MYPPLGFCRLTVASELARPAGLRLPPARVQALGPVALQAPAPPVEQGARDPQFLAHAADDIAAREVDTSSIGLDKAQEVSCEATQVCGSDAGL